MFGEFESNTTEKGETVEEENFDLPLRERIIDHIAKRTDIVVKSQQRHEPDLSYEERKTITDDILDKSPSQFLYRFGKHLKREHFLYFNSFSENEEVNFYLEEAQKQLNESTQRLKMRNRRFGALKKMESSGSSYFKDEEMRKRDPLLFHELVDKNMTEEERQQSIREAPSSPLNTFSELLFEQIERNKINARRREQENAEEDCYEEVEEEDEESEDEVEEKKEEEPLDERQKFLLRDEFRTTLFARFVSGKEKDFDYSAVDDQEENDLLDWETQDLEEKYFDEEEPETLSKQSNNEEMDL
ncbi:UNVERIFIED_CONTAM: hypothetical protein RMT77_014209 [Armadillidium vulgare]